MGKKYILDDKICKEFTLIDIATVEYGNKFDKNKMSRIKPSINFVSRTATNNGVSDFVDNNGTIPYKKGLITLALGGSIGSCFLQEQPFYTGQNVGVIDLGDIDYHAKIYFTEALGYKCKKSFSAFGNEINKHLKTDLSVSLPIKQYGNGDPVIDIENKYHQKGYVPDWDFMQKYIEELEKERIEELEKERIEELEKYLIATGLNDYQLTDEDIDVLSLSLSGFGHQEERNCEDVVKICKEFKLSDLFTKKTMKGYPKADENLDENLNGYYVYGQNIKRQHSQKILLDPKYLHNINEENPILAYTSSVGEIGMICEPFYRSGNNGAFQGLYSKHHKFNRYELQFILSVLRKYFDNFGYSTGMSHVMDLSISLPIEHDKNNNPLINPEHKYHPDGYIPDWDFMEKYIKAIEKVVIADVVKYKDEIIAKTKTTVG